MTMRYDLTLVTRPSPKSLQMIQGGGCGEKGAQLHRWWGVHGCRHDGELPAELPGGSAAPLLGTHIGELPAELPLCPAVPLLGTHLEKTPT